MSDFRLIKSEVLPLTSEFAEEFRKLTPSPTERDLDPRRVRMLRDKAEAGHLITFLWSRVKLPGGSWMRANGQHSSQMLCELNGEFPPNLKVHLDEYEVDDMTGLAFLFRQFDDRKSGRSTADVSGAYQGLYEDLRVVDKKSAKLAVEGVAYYLKLEALANGAKYQSGDDIYGLFERADLHPFIKWIGDTFSVKTPELKRAQIVAAMYATYLANETEAHKFWAQVARGGDEFDDTAPATVLDGWLKALKEPNGKKREIKPAHIYYGCVFAWNAYRENKPVKDVKYTFKTAPKVAE
jgi:hypothetical protein